MEKTDYPLLFQESDSTAIKAQKNYFRLVMLKILFLITVAVITSINWPGDFFLRTPIAVILAITMILSIGLTAIMSTRNTDKTWLFSRKMAEEVKTETWKFMMHTDEYNASLVDSGAEQVFLDRLNEILHRNSIVCSQLASQSSDSSQITEFMRTTRQENLKNRIAIYLKDRLHNQRCWYTEKAKWNKSQEFKWFTVTWILELIAVSIAVINIVMSDMIISSVSLVLAAGGGILSWINARSYSEPAESYGIISHELSLIEERTRSLTSEKDLTDLVVDVENLIMQEHSIWLSRLI
ncbi:MAG: DUF4231 domain-containing protein [Candidatus Bathyarchaeota archaeon]|jgi:hypothetical protein